MTTSKKENLMRVLDEAFRASVYINCGIDEGDLCASDFLTMDPADFASITTSIDDAMNHLDAARKKIGRFVSGNEVLNSCCSSAWCDDESPQADMPHANRRPDVA